VNCGFDCGLAVDHIILAYRENLDRSLSGIDVVPEEWRERQEITLELSKEFLSLHQRERCRFTPLGIAQGWSPKSYASAFESLEKLGYDTDRGFGANFEREAGATCGGWTRFRKPGAYNHTARHAVECAE